MILSYFDTIIILQINYSLIDIWEDVMKKEHLIKVIEAIEAVTELDEVFIKLTGNDLGLGDCSALYGLWDIIIDAVKPEFRKADDSEGTEQLYDVLKNCELSAIEKYDILIEK